jgi:hypothetical protein
MSRELGIGYRNRGLTENAVTERIGTLTLCVRRAEASAEVRNGDTACAPCSECIYIKVEVPDLALFLVPE